MRSTQYMCRSRHAALITTEERWMDGGRARPGQASDLLWPLGSATAGSAAVVIGHY